MGSMSTAEAELKWKQMLGEANTPRDEAGPRGAVRLRVVAKDLIIGFEELAQEKALSQEARLGNNTTNDQMKAILENAVLADNDGEHNRLLDFFDLKSNAVNVFATGFGNDKGILDDQESGGILQMDIKELMDSLHKKNKTKSQNGRLTPMMMRSRQPLGLTRFQSTRLRGSGPNIANHLNESMGKCRDGIGLHLSIPGRPCKRRRAGHRAKDCATQAASNGEGFDLR